MPGGLDLKKDGGHGFHHDDVLGSKGPYDDVAKNDKADTTIDVTQHEGSNQKDDCSDLTDNNNDGDEQTPKTFPQKLMDILSSEEHVHIISWLPHGNGFVIHKKKTFASEILPKYFKASKFTSFTRKLNRWGFSRVPRGPETGAYYHKLFRRDKPEMSMQMTSNSGTKYQHNPLRQHLLPSMPGMAAGMPMFPYMPPHMMASMGNLTPEQQQAMWAQSMQMMQFQMMQQMQQGQQQQPSSMMMMPFPMQDAKPDDSSPHGQQQHDGGGGGGMVDIGNDVPETHV